MISIINLTLKVNNLEKTYNNGFKAIENISFSINEGEVLGIIGPNGGGKSTLLLCMCRVLKSTKGSINIFVNNKKIDEANQIKRIIGYLPEEANLYNDLTGYENLQFYAKFFGIPKKQISSLIQRLINKIDLKEFINKKVYEYSSGMKKKLILARALIHNPKLLILDEPTNNLDPTAKEEIKKVVMKLKEENNTIIISSHDLSEIEDICDKYLVLNKTVRYFGEIEAAKELQKAGVIVTITFFNDVDKKDLEFKLQNFPLLNIIQFTKEKVKINLNEISLVPQLISLLVKNNYQILEVKTEDISLKKLYFTYANEQEEGEKK